MSKTDQAAATPPAIEPVTIEITVRMKALAIPEANGGYTVVIPAFPGCVTAAYSPEEIQAMATEVAELCLEDLEERHTGESLKLVAE